MPLTQKQKTMQNVEENLYNLLSTKTFDELASQERKYVVCYLTEAEYRNQTKVLQMLERAFTSNPIESDLNSKKLLDEKLGTLKNASKNGFPFYKIAACFAFFILLTFVYIKNKQYSTPQTKDKPIAQQPMVLEKEAVITQNIPQNPAIESIERVKINKLAVKKEKRKETQIRQPEILIVHSELPKEGDKSMSYKDSKLGMDIDLKQLMPLCLNSEDTQANDITSQMLKL